ncbi:nucleotidyltransferase domain-containing protein [Candidatus Parcubacteria bacterium]|nr:nucleotidyltransferase domain-containing protein [Candidatus Parcubacteria bacterium]
MTIASKQKEIKRITGRIVEKYKPEKIILFGSFAYGNPTKDSDADLFIIKKTKQLKTKRILKVDRMLLDRNIPLDILVYTPQEVKNRILLGDFFIRNIIQKGKILYVKK